MPSWVEEAARRVLEERSSSDGGVSVAELTLVTAAPKTHMAASPRRASGGATPASTMSGSAPERGGEDEPALPDIEEMAREVYGQICRMLEVARERSGDPWSR